MDLNLTLKVID